MNMQAMLRQAQQMQREIMKKKEEIDKKIFPGKSEWVEVEFNGKKEIQSVKIMKKDLKSDDFEMLEDMIMIAIKDANSKIDNEIASKLEKYSSLSGLI